MRNAHEPSIEAPAEQDVTPHPLQDPVMQFLIVQIEDILRYARDREQHFSGHLQAVHPEFQASARNLLHYLALRNFNLRELQAHLAERGLSSLGRTEAHVMASLHAVLGVLYQLSGRESSIPDSLPASFEQGDALLSGHTGALFGPKPSGRNVHIMVTFPSEAADDHTLVRDLVTAGMDCVRINCAHDGEEAWVRMIEHVRQAEHETGLTCRILMDLGGPKLRTGPLEPGPRVLHLKPHRDL